MSCDPDESSYFYEVVIKTLLILCVHYGVIKNEWQDDRNKICKPIIEECKKELNKLGYTEININYDDEKEIYYSSINKN